MKINCSKSNVIVFGTRYKRDSVLENVNILVKNERLELVNHVKSLGVVLDADLRFEKHVNNLIGRPYSTIKLIYGNRQFLSSDIKKLLCESLILSIFNYADILYGPCLTSQYKQKIQKVQNSCLRLIFGIRRRLPISHKLKEIGWLNMYNRRTLHAANTFHKIIVSKTPLYLYRKITYRTHVHNLNIRHKSILPPPPFRLELFRRCFSCHVCAIYNNVPNSLKSVSHEKFKKSYRNVLYAA